MRSVLLSVIENARVTHTHDSAALRVDAYIMRAAELMPFERVQVIGERETFITWVEPAAEGSGEVRAQQGVRVGDLVTIVAFTDLHEGQTLAHKPKRVILNAGNAVVSVVECSALPPPLPV